jgi:hypothetical protein
VVDSLKALDPKRPIREADMAHRRSSKKKSRPKAALNSNQMIVDQAASNAGFDFRR